MMRTLVGAGLGLMLVLALAGPARAQTTPSRGMTIPFGNFGSQKVQFQVVDTRNQNPIPIAQPQTINTDFSLSNLMPRLNPRPSNQTVIGLSQFPTKDGMPGINYLRAFGYSRAQPVR